MTRVPEQPLFGLAKTRPAGGRQPEARTGFTFGDALKSGKARAHAHPADRREVPAQAGRAAEPFPPVIALKVAQRLDALPDGPKILSETAAKWRAPDADDEEAPSFGEAREKEVGDDRAVLPIALPPADNRLPATMGFHAGRESGGGRRPGDELGEAGALPAADDAGSTPQRNGPARPQNAPAHATTAEPPQTTNRHEDQRNSTGERTTVAVPRGKDDTPPVADAPRRPAATGQAVKVSVEQAPLPPIPPNATALSQVIAEAMSPGNAAPAAFARDIPATHGQQPFKILKIELHPAELGAVTARLKAVGDGLSIEIEVETDEAYRRLSHDREAIGQQLRGLGYTVDSVTILQPAMTVNAGARAESAPVASGPRGGESAPAGDGSGRNGSETGGRKGGNGHGGQDRDTASGPARLRAGGGVYI